MLKSPFPCSLKSEAKKAAKILREFAIPSTTTGIDKIIPGSLIKKAKGLAVLTVIKAGFLLTARGGSGIVVARLAEDGGWSAPSAIGIAGLGGGLEIGAEVTDFVIILNTVAAVEAFSKGGNMTLGGNMTVAVGPLGRNMEGDVAMRGAAAIYTYSKTKGLFVGISIEGSAIIERKEANRNLLRDAVIPLGRFYEDSQIRASDILMGKVERPSSCQDLYDVLEHHDELAAKAADELAEKSAERKASSTTTTACTSASTSASASRRDSSKRWSAEYSTSGSTAADKLTQSSYARTSAQQQTHNPWSASTTAGTSVLPKPPVTASSIAPARPHVRGQGLPQERISRSQAIRAQYDCTEAIYPFVAQRECDLSFQAGDIIEVLTRTSIRFDWWEGRLHGHVGLFPANYTK